MTYFSLFRKHTPLFIIFLFLFCFVEKNASAQIIGQNINDIVLISNPKYPEPLSPVSITVVNNVIDLNRATIIWYQNGVEKKRGIGEKNFTFTTGNAGSETLIRVYVETVQGPSFTNELVLRPTTLDVLWEAETTTPLFYQGKALPGSESAVRVVALPHFIFNGTLLNPSNLYYEWKLGSRLISSASGKGKSVLTINAPKTFGQTEVTVTVSSPQESFVGQKTITIEAVEPEVHLYRISPERNFNLGDALKGELVFDQEFTLEAVPYYFSKNKSLSFLWSQGGRVLANKDRRVSFREGEGGFGNITSLSISVENPSTLLQRAQTKVLVTKK